MRVGAVGCTRLGRDQFGLDRNVIVERFTDLRTGLPEISTRVLTERLEELTAAAVIPRHRLAPPAGPGSTS